MLNIHRLIEQFVLEGTAGRDNFYYTWLLKASSYLVLNNFREEASTTWSCRSCGKRFKVKWNLVYLYSSHSTISLPFVCPWSFSCVCDQLHSNDCGVSVCASRIYSSCICLMSSDVWLPVHLLLGIAVSELAPLERMKWNKNRKCIFGSYPCPLPIQQKEFRFSLLGDTLSPVTSNVLLHR